MKSSSENCYVVNSKAYGVVLNIYPKPEFRIPIFTFQLGGQIPDKVIFVLDILPVTGSMDEKRLADLYALHSSGMDTLGTTQDWIRDLCSPNALVCQYRPMDPEKILKALSGYLAYWRDAFYLPAQPDPEENSRKTTIENILRFKRILHANDVGLEIYQRKFGKAMAEAIETAAFGANPALKGQEKEAADTPVIQDAFSAGDNIIRWSEDAEQYLQDAPRFVRSKIRENAEKLAAESGITVITRSFIGGLRK